MRRSVFRMWIGCAAFCAIASSVQAGSTDLDAFTENCRIGGVNGVCIAFDGVNADGTIIPLASGTAVIWADAAAPIAAADDCGGGHRTRKTPGGGSGPTQYEHGHFSFTVPHFGIYRLSDGTVSTAAAGRFNYTDIRGYYDWYYAGFTPSGTESVTYNCHGYSDGNGTWVNNANIIWSTDYDYVSNPSAGDILQQGDTHSIKVVSVVVHTPPVMNEIHETSEKFRSSRIYNWVYGPGFPDGPPPGFTNGGGILMRLKP